jgi:hypothetical protein
MALGLLFTTYYDLYVALLHAAIQLAVFLSLLVAGDRILNISKYVLIKARAKLTGRLPQHAWNFKPLPIDYAEYPRVSVLPWWRLCCLPAHRIGCVFSSRQSVVLPSMHLARGLTLATMRLGMRCSSP